MTTTCKSCGKPTASSGTELCDFCWKIDWRLENLNWHALTYFLVKMKTWKRLAEKEKTNATTS